MEKKKKKILIFATTYHPFVGGAEVAVKEITDRLGGDFDFDMVTARLDKKLPEFEKLNNINIYRVGTSFGIKKQIPRHLTNFLYIFYGFKKAGELHKKRDYNLTWSIMAAYAGAIGLFFKITNQKIPFLLTLQEGDDPSYIKSRLGWYKEPIWRLLFKKADMIQVISNFLEKWAKKNGSTSPIVVVPNAVNVKHFSQNYSSKELKDLKSQLGKRQNDQYIITTSRLVSKNAVGDIIKSLNYLPDSFKLLILGDGPDREELEVLTKKQRVENRVKFFGTVDYAEIPKYLKISDVFVRPSLSEGFGNSFIEAMASEIPVIATPVGGIVDFLKDKETGLFCEVQNPRSIADQIRWLEENVSQKEDIIKKAKRMVVKKYDWQKVTKDMKAKVFNILFRSPGPK